MSVATCIVKKKEGIRIHKYGAHIFHTSNKEVSDYVNQFVTFNQYVNSPVANYKGELYNLPFNMNTFSKMWGVVTPAAAAAKIAEQRTAIQGEPKNLEEQAYFSDWHRCIYKTYQGLYGKAVGAELY
jgi:UDP-galactopyranose mutase